MVGRLFASFLMIAVTAGSLFVSRGAGAAGTSPAILVIGDSQAQGVAGALQRWYLRSREFRVLDRSKIGTGLNSKLTYDWKAAVEQLVNAEHADVAVVMFGANDRPPVRVGGAVDPGRAAAFSRSYAARVADIVKTLRQAHLPVIWLGDPIVKDADYSADMAMLNEIIKPAAETGGAIWVPLWDVGADDSGAYAAYGKALDGQTKRLRADDGVHFTPAGYDLIAARLQPVIKTALAAAPDQAAPGPAAAPVATVRSSAPADAASVPR